jgi:hypothetical protein
MFTILNAPPDFLDQGIEVHHGLSVRMVAKVVVSSVLKEQSRA